MIKRCTMVLIVTGLILLTGCRTKIDMQYLEKLANLSDPRYKGEAVAPQTLEVLKATIDKYRAALSLQVDAADQLAIYYKNIATRYLDIGYFEKLIEANLAVKAPDIQDSKEQAIYNQSLGLLLAQKKLYSKAYEYFYKALMVTPANEVLYYNLGLCASNISKAELIENPAIGEGWLSKAEKYYKQAIGINPNYTEALYGLSIILVYETGRPDEAIGYLLHLTSIESANFDARFVLATAYYQTGDLQAAAKEYAFIEQTTILEDKKKQARSNREQIEAMLLKN